MDVQLSLKDIYEYTKAVGVECEFVLKGARALHARGQGDTGTRGDAKIHGRVVRKKSLLMRGVFAGTGCGGKKS
jgi:hypothetical protein